ncbi:hypothetical protein [Marinobacter algicola]|uniref:hypothetical protein n=1 Tax=Marinobacter algicola TaxID=236100 RepID=UPI0002EAF9FC|nr:hypothetical protein [Marinobacter algicola]
MSQPFGPSGLPLIVCSILFALVGCGDGGTSSSSSSSQAGQDNSDPGVTAKSLPELDGYIEYDYSLRGTNENPRVYRRNLKSHSLAYVQAGGKVGGQVFAGGVFTNDFFAPAAVTASSTSVSIHSRVDGTSVKLSNIGDGQEPCSVQGFVNSDLSTGLVNLTMSGGNLTCDLTVDSDDTHYWWTLGANTFEVWEADGLSSYTDVFFNGEGDIDFVVANNYAEKTIILYGESGAELQSVTGSTWVPRIYPMAEPGLTRDETFVGVLSDGEFLITSVAMLLDSGLAGAQPVLSGLSEAARLASLSLIEDDKYTIIADNGLLYKVDEINRSASFLADFSDKIADGWALTDVVVISDKAIVLMTSFQGADRADPVSEVYNVDLGSGEVDLLLAAESTFVASRTESLLFINFLDSSGRNRTLIVGRPGGPVVPNAETYYATSVNLARGGDQLKVLAMTSSVERGALSPAGLLNPNIWVVNEHTGNATSKVMTLPYNCYSMDAFYAINNHLSVVSFCEDGFAIEELELERGTLSFVTSDARVIN